MNCKEATFGGFADCAALMEKMNGGLLQNKGLTWTETTILDLATWRVATSSQTLASRTVIPLPIHGFENTTDDPEVTTTQLGKKLMGSKPIPSGMLDLEVSICDYNEMHDLEGPYYQFFPSYQDGTFWATRKADGSLSGFKVKVATKAGLPPEDKSKSFPMYLFFDSYAEFKNIVVVSPDWTFSDLNDYTPLAMSMNIVTALAVGGNVVIKVVERCKGTPITGLVLGDFAVLDSNGTPVVAITALTEDGQGQYTLTIQADSAGVPADLTAGQYATIQATQNDGTYATHLSSPLKVTA